MLPLTLDRVLDPAGIAAWDDFVAAQDRVHLYHGTSLERAERIMHEGFRARFGFAVEDDRIATYWGCAQVAANFAHKAGALDHSPPALFEVDLADVIASGDPMPLRTDADDCNVEYPDWRACFKDTHSLWVRGGRYVAGMTLHTVSADGAIVSRAVPTIY